MNGYSNNNYGQGPNQGPNQGAPNRLISGYFQHQQTSVPFQNNSLLQNNPMFVNNVNYNNSHQMQQMQQMQQAQMQRAKELQKIKHIERLNALEKTVNKEQLRDAIIKPIKVDKKNDDVTEMWDSMKPRLKAIDDNLKDPKAKEHDPTIKKYWSGRTNQPYKNIMKNEDYTKTFKKKEDLIVHKVTTKDKEGVIEDFEKFQKTLEKHKDELKIIYSQSEELSHKKKFEYNHKFKFVRMKDDQSNQIKLKTDNIEYYKKEQKKLEKNKERLDNILESMVNDGVFTEAEIKEIEKSKTSLNELMTETQGSIDKISAKISEESNRDPTKSSEYRGNGGSGIIETSVVPASYLPQKSNEAKKQGHISQHQHQQSSVKKLVVNVPAKSTVTVKPTTPVAVATTVRPAVASRASGATTVKPAASVTTVKPAASVTTVKPAASVTTVRPAATVTTVRPAASVTTVRPTATTTVKPAASVTTVRPAASVTTVRPAASVTTVRPAASVTTVKPAASVTTIRPAATTTVRPAATTTVRPAATTTTVRPAASVTNKVQVNESRSSIDL